MPGFDRTGPMGTGPIGRGLGPCGGGGAFGRGYRFGFGRGGFGRGGFGWRWNDMPIQTPEEETASLEQEKKWLESQLEAINQRIEKNKNG